MKQGSISGENVNLLHVNVPMWSSLILARCDTFKKCGLSLFSILVLIQASSYPPPQKQTSPNSNLTSIEELHENQLRLMWLFSLNIVI